MAFRKRMSRMRSRRNFRGGNRVHKRNRRSTATRGGYRI